jgi:hypothetical protein
MHTMIARARASALATPPHRDRVVDFMRVAAMVVVVFGHWLMAVIWASPDGVRTWNALSGSESRQLLTWVFQVMPIFFFAGGFSNHVSMEAAARDGIGEARWLAARARRLLAPLVPLVVFWAGLTLVLTPLVDPQLVRVAAMTSFVPVWFLSVYVGVVALAPLTHRLWRRWGWWSVVAGATVAVLLDVARFGFGQLWLGWGNFLFLWATVHQAGYGWERWRTPRVGRFLAPVGLAALVGMVTLGPYPVSLIGFDHDLLNNTRPPSVALLAVAVMQAGLLGLAAPSLDRWLGRIRPWTFTVLGGGMIMTWFTWHMTVMVLVAGLDLLWGGFILRPEPFGALWWMTRPLWLALLFVVTFGVVALALRFEVKGAGPPRPVWVVMVGLWGAVAALAWLVLFGISIVPVAGFVAAAMAAGALPGRPRAPAP